MEEIDTHHGSTFAAVLVGLLICTVVGCAIGVLLINNRYEKKRADFFQQVHERTVYRTECYESAARITNSYDTGTVVSSQAYQACSKAEPAFPAL